MPRRPLFDDTYPHRHSFTQRVSAELRVPRPEGMQFVAASQDPERHFLLKNVLLQPLQPFTSTDPTATRKSTLLHAYRQYCCPAADSGQVWHAQSDTPGEPGPFQRTFDEFFLKAQSLASTARCKLAKSRRMASLWETQEVQAALSDLASAKSNHGEQDAEDAEDTTCASATAAGHTHRG